MGWQILQQKAKEKLHATFIELFHGITITLLSVLLPLSFLLLARLSCYSYLLSVESDPTRTTSFKPSSLLLHLLLHSNPAILNCVVSVFTVATLLHGLTGKFNLLEYRPSSPDESQKHHLYSAWIILCTLQVCVGLGIEGSIAAGIEGHSFDIEKSLISRIVFFLGLHETMLYWSRTVVKPVVDDTVFGFARDEKWVHRLCLAMSFGILWWWRLRDEVESLVIVAEAKREMLIGVGIADLLAWWLYYVTVTIGMVRIVKSLMWVSTIFLCKRVRRNNSHDRCAIDDKV